MPVYLLLDIGSILIPLIFSFHPRLRFDKQWSSYLPAILLSMFLYIIWDVWFTAEGVWGFNPDYLVGIDILNLPIEEWLFFICIPYACLFTHHCISVLAYKKVVPSQITAVIAWVLIVSWIIVAIVFNDRLYTVVNFLWAIPLVLFVVIKKRHILQRFFVTYLLIGLPFIIVNGILTGALNPEPIVWYDNSENLGIRFFMPIEDYTYAFTMLLFPLAIADSLRHHRVFDSKDKKH